MYDLPETLDTYDVMRIYQECPVQYVRWTWSDSYVPTCYCVPTLGPATLTCTNPVEMVM